MKTAECPQSSIIAASRAWRSAHSNRGIGAGGFEAGRGAGRRLPRYAQPGGSLGLPGEGARAALRPGLWASGLQRGAPSRLPGGTRPSSAPQTNRQRWFTVGYAVLPRGAASMAARNSERFQRGMRGLR